MGMKTLLFISTLVVLTSCSLMDFTDEDHFYVDPPLKIFVNRFYHEAEIRQVNPGRNMIMVLSNDLHANITGIDGLTIHNLNEIKIDRNFTLGKLSQKTHEDSLTVEFVVFHEMAHLLLNRGHVDDSVYSIMTPDFQWLYDYQTDSEKRKILIDELFSYSIP